MRVHNIEEYEMEDTTKIFAILQKNSIKKLSSMAKNLLQTVMKMNKCSDSWNKNILSTYQISCDYVYPF